jgi:hypothetical protein
VNKNQKGDADCAENRWSSDYLALIISNQVAFYLFFLVNYVMHYNFMFLQCCSHNEKLSFRFLGFGRWWNVQHLETYLPRWVITYQNSFFLLNSLHFHLFFILLLNIITCMKDLVGLFCACYLLLATTPVSGFLLKDHGIDLN